MRYFEVHPSVGLDPDGCPQSLSSYSVNHGGPPTMVQGEVVDTDQSTAVEAAEEIGLRRGRIIPNTRLFEVADEVLANAMARDPKLCEIDPPTAQQLVKAEEATSDHRERRAAEQQGARPRRKPARPAEQETTSKPAVPANTQEG